MDDLAMIVGPAEGCDVLSVRYSGAPLEGCLSFTRPIGIALLAFGALAMMCTPFKEDAPGASDGSSNDAAVAGRPCDPSMPFDTPIVVAGLANIMATSVDGLRFSSDYRTAY